MADYRIPVLENFEFQPGVIDRVNAAPVSPAKGDRYLVIATVASGDDFFGQEGNIATFDGVAWMFDSAIEGMMVWVDDEDVYYYYNGTAWNIWEDGSAAVATHEASYNHSLLHTQNTDTSLDVGGPNEISAAQAKEAYTRRGQYDADYGAITMTI